MIEELIFQGKLDELKVLAYEKGTEYIKCNSNNNELAAIHWVASSGNIEIMEFYLFPPVSENPNLTRINNFSPLHSASMVGNSEIVELLLKNGAIVDIQTEPQKYSPLHSASYGGHLDVAKTLLKYGANPSLKNYRDELPIDTARRQNKVNVVLYLEELKKTIHNSSLPKVRRTWFQRFFGFK